MKSFAKGSKAVAIILTVIFVSSIDVPLATAFLPTVTGVLSSSQANQGLFSSPGGVAVDLNGFIYVVDTGNNRIQKFTNAGVFVSAFGSPKAVCY